MPLPWVDPQRAYGPRFGYVDSFIYQYLYILSNNAIIIAYIIIQMLYINRLIHFLVAEKAYDFN